MIQESAREPLLFPLDEDDEPTQPRIPAQKLSLDPAINVLQSRSNGTLTVSIDEHGTVILLVFGQTSLVLEPEGAFDLLDFLFEFRDFLAARSAEVAERPAETCKERKRDEPQNGHAGKAQGQKDGGNLQDVENRPDE